MSTLNQPRTGQVCSGRYPTGFQRRQRFDGSGYCAGLKGDAIPLSTRIVAVADVYDALTSERCYKKAFESQAALELIVSEAGTHFDPIVVDAFVNCMDHIEQVRRNINIEPKLDRSPSKAIEKQPSPTMQYSRRSPVAIT
jgi:hypothetical protein